MMPTKECCICHQLFFGDDKSPYPVIKDVNARCCPSCYNEIVQSLLQSNLFEEDDD